MPNFRPALNSFAVFIMCEFMAELSKVIIEECGGHIWFNKTIHDGKGER